MDLQLFDEAGDGAPGSALACRQGGRATENRRNDWIVMLTLAPSSGISASLGWGSPGRRTPRLATASWVEISDSSLAATRRRLRRPAFGGWRPARQSKSCG